MESIGQYLKEKREAKGLSLEEIALATRIQKRYLEAIEQDRLVDLPEGLYHKVFVRAYADKLGLPLEELNRKLIGIEETAEWRGDYSLSRSKSKRLDKIFIGAGVFLIAMVLFLLLKKPGQNEPTEVEQANLKALQALPLSPVDQSAEGGAGSLSSESIELRIEATGFTSVLVVSGPDTLLHQVLGKGEVRTWKSPAGFYLSLEPPRHARVIVNGKPLTQNLAGTETRWSLEVTPTNLAEIIKSQTGS